VRHSDSGLDLLLSVYSSSVWTGTGLAPVQGPPRTAVHAPPMISSHPVRVCDCIHDSPPSTFRTRRLLQSSPLLLSTLSGHSRNPQSFIGSSILSPLERLQILYHHMLCHCISLFLFSVHLCHERAGEGREEGQGPPGVTERRRASTAAPCLCGLTQRGTPNGRRRSTEEAPAL
jgi:hypothetical protein